MGAIRLITAHRLDPKKVFRCALCNPPPERPRVCRRYRFVLKGGEGQKGDYCLRCASRLLGRSQGDLRREADAK